MIDNSNDRVNGHFVIHSRDLTPASARHACCVLYAPVSRDPEVSMVCASVLSESERQSARRISSGIEQERFLQRRAFRRFCAANIAGSQQSLSQIHFSETENGRPYLAAHPLVRFSFSSCRFGFLGAWSSTHGVGVDLEDQTKNLEAAELAHHFFSPAEAKAVDQAGDQDRLPTFFQLWTLKEAALKSIGEGLPFGLDAFEFEPGHDPRVVRAPPDHGGAGQFRAYLIKGFTGCAALVVQDPF